MQNTQASYPRVCTHESQSFSTELLESKGTGSEHLPQSHHLIFTFLLCIFLLTAQFSYCLHTTAQFSKSRLLSRFEIDMSDNIYAAFERMFYRPLFSTVHTGIVRRPRKQSLSIRPACPDNRLRSG